MHKQNDKASAKWRTPVLGVIALIMILAMLRLGVWQLDRAEQKQEIANQLALRASQPASEIQAISEQGPQAARFRSVSLTGHYLSDKTMLVDNQVVNGGVGYQVFTPFAVDGFDQLVLIARGWVSVGESREIIPEIFTNEQTQSLAGRLNNPPAEPPLWNDDYAVQNGQVWQYLPISQVSSVLDAKVFPLVVELAPEASDSAELVRKWPEIDDQWVAKHQGYAFQWFAMALAFFIACLVLLLKKRKTKPDSETV